jgi:hypothetical protein
MVHPFITLLAIVVTGNHYWIDAAIAGVLVVAAVSCWPGGVAHPVERPTPSRLASGGGDAACAQAAVR